MKEVCGDYSICITITVYGDYSICITIYIRKPVRNKKISLHNTTITLGHEPEGIVLHAENRLALNSACYDFYTLMHSYTVTNGLKN